MAGTFILSFDCEGKWGIADQVTPFIESHFTNSRLNDAYASILQLLERYRVFATFAFVGAFTLSEREYLERRDWFESSDPWLQRFLSDASKRTYDGWLNPRALEMVTQISGHEIACHGFTHRPLCESLASMAQMRAELSYLRKLTSFESANTFIFPRNLVGYESMLPEFGFTGYRAGVRSVRGSWKRAASLLRELDIFAPSESVTAQTSGLTVIPGGHILNWRKGLRGKIPMVVSLLRIQSMIQHAIRENQVVHLWSHPHNFITGKGMYSLLDGVLKMVAEERKAGRLDVLTQAQFVANAGNHSLSTRPMHGAEVLAT